MEYPPGLDHYLSGEAIKEVGEAYRGQRAHMHTLKHARAPGLWRGANEEEPWNKRCFVLANKSQAGLVFK